MKKCPYCSASVQDDARICPICHMSVVAPPSVPGTPTAAGAVPPGSMPPGAFAQANAPTSGKAVGSLVCGILGFVILPVISAIPAIVLGHLSLSEIKRSAGRIKGQGLAIAGLVLGYMGIALIPFILIIAAIAIPNLLRAKMAANEASAVGSLRSYSYALGAYAAKCPQIGFPHTLGQLGPGGADCEHADLLDRSLGVDHPLKSGYRFTYERGETDSVGQTTGFVLRADPITQGTTGMRHFYADQTGTIRFNLGGPADADSQPIM